MIKVFRKTAISILEFIRHKKSYAQDGEDVALSAFFEEKKGYKGFFIDVGAHHPIRFSNTWMFYQKGWKGINIDPTPRSMRWFHKIRSRDINLEIGIGAHSGNMTFFCFNEPALNTFDEGVAKSRDTRNPYYITNKVSVPIKTLAEVLDKYLPTSTTIDFLSVDVEGFDLSVLKSNDWSKYKPHFILVEDTKFDLLKPQESEIFTFLSQIGYNIKGVLKRTIIYQYSL
jgi:FkbM family methyltransferase